MRREEARGIWLLLDFSPYLRYAMSVRMLREIVLGGGASKQTVVLIGAKIELPPELEPLATRFSMRLPDDAALAKMLRDEVFAYSRENGGRRVEVDAAAQRAVLRHLRGLPLLDAPHRARPDLPRRADRPGRRRARAAHGSSCSGAAASSRWSRTWRAWTKSPASAVSSAGWSNVARCSWRTFRPRAWTARAACCCWACRARKSLAAKACAGGFGVPLLRLDFGALYNKFHGETERTCAGARHRRSHGAVRTVVRRDREGLATSDSDDGVSRRVLGTLLTG